MSELILEDERTADSVVDPKQKKSTMSCAAPMRRSATAARLTSFSMKTGTPIAVCSDFTRPAPFQPERWRAYRIRSAFAS